MKKNDGFFCRAIALAKKKKLLKILWSSDEGRSLPIRSDLHIARKIWHMGMGLFMALAYSYWMSRGTAVLLLGIFLSLFLMIEVARLKWPVINRISLKLMGSLMRSHEIDKISGTPFYIGGVLVAVVIFPKSIAILSILLLAFGDPIASFFGVLYGDRSIRFSNGKSLIGSLAGVIACLAVSLIYLAGFPYPTQTVFILAAVGGLVGGLTELLPIDVDDNFSIPVISGFSLWFAHIVISYLN